MRVGLIGFGYWGKMLSRCFSEVPGADVFFIADISAVRREEARRLFPRAMLASRWAELLGADNVDAVAIATPANTHFGIAKAALDAGKHIWVEKPLAETISQAKALHMFAQQRERVLFIDHTFLYDASVRLIKEILAQKKFEEIRYYQSIRTNSGQPRTDTSIFHDLAIHDFAILDFLVDESPLAVSARKNTARGIPAPGEQRIALSYSSGLKAELCVNWCASTKARRIAITSDSQTLEFDDMELHHKMRLHEFPSLVTAECGLCNVDAVRRNGRVLQLPSRKEPLAKAVESFLHCISTGERPVSDGWQGVRLAAVVDSCLLSAETDGRWVNVISVV
jgi:predicted dehydrogenase